MTNAQTEARAIAERLSIHHSDEDRIAIIATAIAAKDAELAAKEDARAEQWRLRRDAGASRDVARAACDSMRIERDEARAHLAEANKALDQIAAIEPQSNCDAGSMARSRMRDIARLYIARRAREAQGGE